jgi:hypothetical protein
MLAIRDHGVADYTGLLDMDAAEATTSNTGNPEQTTTTIQSARSIRRFPTVPRYLVVAGSTRKTGHQL